MFKKDRYRDRKGNFNKEAFLYLQHLDAPTGSQVATSYEKSDQPFTRPQAVEIPAAEGVSQFVTSKKTAFQDTFNTICAMQPHLWTPRAMSGAEYECGGFQASVSHHAAKQDLVFSTVPVDINTRILPSVNDMLNHKNGKPLNTQWSEAHGINIPWTLESVDIHIITHKKDMKMAQQMVKHLAEQYVEQGSHRGVGFNRTLAYQTLSDENKEKVGAYNDIKAWYEIKSGVFFTHDKEIFEKTKIAFNATEYKKPKTVFGFPIG